MTISTGFSFVPGGFPAGQAARARSLTLDANNNLALAAMSWASGGQSYSVLSFNPTTSGWSSEASGLYPYQFPMAVLVSGASGYTLDAASGLWKWGGGLLASGNAPYTAAFFANSGIYLTNPTSIFTSGGSLVASGFSGVFAGVGSGAYAWLLGANSAYYVALSGGATQTTTLSFTPLAITASGASVAIAGQQNFTLGSGVYHALAVGVSGSTLVAFPGSGIAQSWVLSGSPLNWSALATTTGLPSYSTGICASFTQAGNQILLSDYGSGRWIAFSYTGGSLSLLSQGSVTGITAGLAITSNSALAGIPCPGSSGVYVLEASGASWAASGVVGSGWFSNTASIAALSSNTFAVSYSTGSSGIAAQLSYSNPVWSSGNSINLSSLTPQSAFYDSTIGLCYFTGSSGLIDSIQWNLFGATLIQTGSVSGAGNAIGIVSQGNQPLIITSGSLYSAKTILPTAWARSQSLSGTYYSISSPLADYSIPIATSSGISFYSFVANSSISPVQQGVLGLIVSGGAAISNLTTLGYSITPSSLFSSNGNQILLTTEQGGIGFFTSGATTLNYCLTSGGFSNLVLVSGQIWATTTVPGSLVAVSGFYSHILDQLSYFPQIAYSVRLLTGSYSGACMNVRRSSDSATMDIGFVNGVLDTATLITFCGSGNGFVTIWYNQASSGSTGNAVQSTAGSQPSIVSGGVVNTLNSIPTLVFSTSTSLVQNSVSLNPPLSSNVVLAIDDNTNPHIIIANSGGARLLAQSSPVFYISAQSGFNVFSSNFTQYAPYILTSLFYSGSTAALYTNGSTIGSANCGSGVSSGIIIGGSANPISEFSFFGGVALSTSDRQLLEHNQELFYSIAGA